MNTAVLSVDTQRPDPAVVRRAAEVIRAGGLVAFPTETVYGLGANALDAAAVACIFAAKGRPATNPVIVHVADADQVRDVAAEWPESAAKLAAKFWPGPLTLVVPRRPEVPDIVTAGGPTVALRCPAHVVARELIWEAGVPVAAPSANRSTELSPTRAEHVLKRLGGRIDLILDGGPCSRGIESTVVDVTGGAVRVLRPGPITVPMLEEVVGPVETGGEAARGVARSPGQMPKHYSPRTKLRLVEPDVDFGENFCEDWLEALALGVRVGTLSLFGPGAMPDDPARYAAELYSRLHELDAQGLDLILVEMPPDTPEWAAVRDRLTRAAAGG
jgi:L-threonylcarbamoyladenylate synthase